MRNWTVLLLSLVVAIGLLSCAGPPAADTEGQGVNLDSIESGVHSKLVSDEVRFRLYISSKSFGADYARIHWGTIPPPATPAVDFVSSVVIGAFMGSKPSAGFGINLESARVSGTGKASWLEIKVVTTQPPDGAITASVMTSPYSLVRVPRGDWQGIRFRDSSGSLLAELQVPR